MLFIVLVAMILLFGEFLVSVLVEGCNPFNVLQKSQLKLKKKHSEGIV